MPTSRMAAFVLLALSGVALAPAAKAQQQSVSGGHLVRIYWVYDSLGPRFDPSEVVIRRGDTVRFLARSGVPHSLTFDSLGVPEPAIEPLRRLMARIPRASDEPFASDLVLNIGETINIPTDSLPPGRYSFFCEVHQQVDDGGVLVDEDGEFVIEESPTANYGEYYGSGGSATAWPASSFDSVVVQRAACVPACSSYRLSVTRSGAVSLVSVGPAVPTPHVPASVSQPEAAKLFAGARRVGFFDLPMMIRSDQTLCPVLGPSHARLVVTAYRKGGTKQVDYDSGCVMVQAGGLTAAPPVARFAAWAAEIDSAVGIVRWPR